MSDYSKSTNFTTKDTLPSGNSSKIVKGTELDTEFNNIASAISSKLNASNPNLLGIPTAPTASAGTNTNQVATCAFVITNAVPSGFIGMWSGTIATIPSGWYLCNGSNGTPDLRDKFIIGAYLDDAGVAKTNVLISSYSQTGGTKDAVVVSHTHTATSTDSGHTHQEQYSGGTAGTGNGICDSAVSSVTPSAVYTGTGYASISTTIASSGVSGTNQNLPPYFALAFIMKS